MDIMEFAGFWKRLGAYIIDWFIAASGVVIIYLFFGLIVQPFVPSIEGSMVAKGIIVAVFLITLLSWNWLYHALYESSSYQGTLGKRALKIIVTDLDGGQISFGRASIRYWGKLISYLSFLVGFILVGLTEKKQGIHDFISDTLVINNQ